MSVDAALLGRTLAAHLRASGRDLAFRDRTTGATHPLPAEAAGDPAGLLPVFAVAGEAIWREATGKSFALDIRPDPGALFGRSLHAVGAGTFATVMLSMMEAAAQAPGPRALLVNDLRVQWAAAHDRIEPGPRASPPSGGPTP